jgi:hypothetical protein
VVGTRRTARRTLLIGLLAALAAGEAAGQHPLLPRSRTLLERVALSDAIALAEVTAVDPDRLHLRRVDPLLGELPDVFEVKSSSRDLGRYEVGDLAILFLRGARTPYVHADEARERIHPADPEAARRVAGALEALIAVRGDDDRLLALHLAWLASPDENLQRLAVNAFLLPEPLFAPLSPEQARELARIATDPDRGIAERRASALVASTRAAGLDSLVAAVPGTPAGADAVVTEQALSLAALRRAPGTADALRRTLAHPSPEIRRVGLTIAERQGSFAAAREMVARMAEGDPDVETRRRAQRALKRLDR